MKLDWSAINEFFFRTHRIATTAVMLGVILLGTVLYMTDCGSNWAFNRGVKKDKEAIKEKTTEIANKTAQIEVLKQERSQDLGELKVLTDNLANANMTDQTAKNEVIKAAANLERIVNTNANAVNATVEDINKKLDQLGIK